MLQAETVLVVTATKIGDTTYQRFLIHVPPQVVTDSQFPFKVNQQLKIDVDPTTTAITLSEANNPKRAPPRRKKR